MRQGLLPWGKALRIACAMLMLLLGLGHQPATAAVQPEAFREAYRLPDGSFASICSEGEHGHPPFPAPRCEVCLLAASVLLPPPDHEAWLPGTGLSLTNPLPLARHVLRADQTLRPRSRAPPRVA